MIDIPNKFSREIGIVSVIQSTSRAQHEQYALREIQLK